MTNLKRFAAAAAATFMFAALLPAQDVQFKSRTKTDFGGAAGGMFKMAAKMGGGEIEQTTYIHGHKMRSDADKTSSIIDLDARKIINLDHGKKQYTEMMFEEMRQIMASMQAQMAGEQNKNAPKVETKVDVKVEPTSEKQEINGLSAKRYFITATATVSPTEEEKKQGQQGGQIVMLNDWWVTKDGPYRATQEFGKAMAEAFGDAGKGGLAMLLGMYPGAGDALKKAADEGRKIEGGAVRQTMYMVTLPAGMKFDRDQLLGGGEKREEKKAEEPKKKGGFGGMLKAAAAKAQGAGESSDAGPPKGQTMLFKSTTDITDVQQTSIDAGMFAPPAGYKKVTPKK